MEFICVEETENSVTHLLESTDETKKAWPYEFQLYITHTLEGRDLTVAWKVVNKDQEIMYFTVGAHPAFNVPILPDTKREDYHLTFSGQKELTYHLLDTRYGTAIPEKSYTLALENGSCQIAEGMFDKDALIFDDGQITKAGIALPDGTPYVEISCEDFRILASGQPEMHHLYAWSHGWDVAIIPVMIKNCLRNRISMYSSRKVFLINRM